jgi:hypothetical protein
MKFVIAYTTRVGGTATENITTGESAQKLLSNWSPSPSATMHQWLQRCDGQGGFAVVETDNAADLLRDLATWSPWLEFQLFPVLDIADTTAITQEALEAARAAV